MNIGERIKFFREKAGLKQTQVAKYLGIDQTYLSKIEANERNVPVELLESLAILFRIDLQDFEKDNVDISPITFSMRSKDIKDEDLHTLAIINKIAHNSKLMADLIKRNDDEKWYRN